MKTLKVLKYIGFGILGVAFIGLVILGVRALWNWLIPGLFHGPFLTFWQTAGLFLLSKILLTGLSSNQHSDHNREWKRRYMKKYGDRSRCEAMKDQNITATEQA
ncbi:MAG: hypothetical protein ABSG89_04630 [Bacteroidales bacterium]|jgi:hypothetical protein